MSNETKPPVVTEKILADEVAAYTGIAVKDIKTITTALLIRIRANMECGHTIKLPMVGKIKYRVRPCEPPQGFFNLVMEKELGVVVRNLPQAPS